MQSQLLIKQNVYFSPRKVFSLILCFVLMVKNPFCFAGHSDLAMCANFLSISPKSLVFMGDEQHFASRFYLNAEEASAVESSGILDNRALLYTGAQHDGWVRFQMAVVGRDLFPQCQRFFALVPKPINMLPGISSRPLTQVPFCSIDQRVPEY